HLWAQRRSLDDLDAGTPRIGNIRDGAAGGTLANGFVELDAFRLKLLHEGLVVLHVETDVVEHTASSRRLFRVGLGEPDLYTREVHDRRVVADAGLPAKGFCIPSLSFGDFRFR